MSTNPFFPDTPVIGSLPTRLVVEKLQEMGESPDTIAAISSSALGSSRREATFGPGIGWFETPPWKHSAHMFGFVPGAEASKKRLAIRHVADMKGDAALRGTRIKITLNRLRVASYPGSGAHRILFEFYAQNQAATATEDLHFTQTYRIRDRDQAGIAGFPIFIGLNVGGDGVKFRCYTVNVKNDGDEKFLDFLETDTFRGGLRLAETMQPALAPLSQLAIGVTKSIAGRNRNVPVQDFYLGMDFGNDPLGARLALGSYIAVQVPESVLRSWNWSDWELDPRKGEIVHKDDHTMLIPYNYVVFGVSPYQG